VYIHAIIGLPGAIGSITLPADESGMFSDTEVSFATSTDVPLVLLVLIYLQK
jgi:hypothetical protein